MVSISAPSFDLNGQVILRKTESSDVYAQSRRVSKTKTLDLGVSLQDLGFTHGDRTLKLTAQRITQADHEAVKYLQENYPQLMVSIAEGLFLGVIESINIQSGDLVINYFVKERLAEN